MRAQFVRPPGYTPPNLSLPISAKVADIDFPSDNPTPPGDVFVPPASIFTPSINAPVAIGITPQVDGGEGYVITGDAFGNNLTLIEYTQTTSNNGKTINATLFKPSSDRFALARCDAAHTVHSFHYVWPQTPNGTGYPIAINNSQLWWAGVSENAQPYALPAMCVVGDTMHIHGQNLSSEGQSFTPVTIPASGTITLICDSGLNYQANQNIYINSAASQLVGNMYGTITSYNSVNGSLVSNIISSTGAGNVGSKWILTQSWLWCQYTGENDGNGQWISPTYVDPDNIEFTVPNNLVTASLSHTTPIQTPTLGAQCTWTLTTAPSLNVNQKVQIIAGVFNSGNSSDDLIAQITNWNAGTKALTANILSLTGNGANGNLWHIYPMYDLWAHSGHGAAENWAGPLPFTVVPTYPYSYYIYATTLTPSGSDDLPTLSAAINTTSNAINNDNLGGTIVLGAGTFNLSATPASIQGGSGRGIWLQGQGVNLTTIQPLTTGTNFGGQFLKFGRASKLTDCTVNFWSGTTNGVISGAILTNVTVSQAQLNSVSASGLNYARNCSFDGANTGGNVVSPGSLDCTFDSCTYKLANGCEAAMFTQAVMLRTYIKNCMAQQHDVTDTVNAISQGRGRITSFQVSSQQGQFAARNNTTIHMAPGPHTNQNGGEQFLWDGQSGLDAMQITGVNGRTLTYTAVPNHPNYVGTTLYITDGKGQFQHGYIVTDDRPNNAFTIDRDFIVPPASDGTSYLSISWTPLQVSIYCNKQQGNNVNYLLGNLNTSASQGFETNGGSDILYHRNSLSTGFQYSWSAISSGGSGTNTPMYGYLIQNNDCDGALYGPRILVGAPGVQDSPNSLGAMNIVMRGNIFTNPIVSCYIPYGGINADGIIIDSEFCPACQVGMLRNTNCVAPDFYNIVMNNCSITAIATGTLTNNNAYSGDTSQGPTGLLHRRPTTLTPDDGFTLIQSPPGQFVNFLNNN